ncbi:hypothetical protein [Leucothrix pacifica]|uniref:Uncharacterized protein n=1 Tax=Leucothrix pacifica TaxID=1247513 RepID=A0A317CMQ5_9GAMM|nr:hypothetical protein [Leucothrix pacifica]PWQ99816.1 hypothetical protein DKW60_04900 [Leucothrix pacifica]
MAKVKRNKPRNPVANAPIMRKGGVHQKSRSGERQQEKQQLKQLVSRVEAGSSGLDFKQSIAA